MGGKSDTVQESKRTTTEPWAPTQPLLAGILGNLGAALDGAAPTPTQAAALAGLETNARAGNPWAPAIGELAHDLLRGGPDRSALVADAHAAYRNSLASTARGDYLDPGANPFFTGVTGAVADDIGSRLAAMYAGAGRDPAGAGSLPSEVARGVSAGLAPVLADEWNRERSRQLEAQAALYGAGNTTAGLLSQLDQTALANRQAGVGVAGAAIEAADGPLNRLLAIEAQRRAIPLDAMARIAGIGVPIAGLGGSSSVNATTTKETREDPARLALGGILGGLGLVGGNVLPAMRGFGRTAGAGYGTLLGGMGLPLYGGASRLY